MPTSRLTRNTGSQSTIRLMAERTEETESSARGRRWTGRLLLVGWWLLIFTATHLPLSSSAGDSPVPDKLIHFVMYAGLGFLLPFWSDRRRHRTLAGYLVLFTIIALYAVADELLQIPVGRTAEWLDGVADLAGGGVGLFANWYRERRSRRGQIDS